METLRPMFRSFAMGMSESLGNTVTTTLSLRGDPPDQWPRSTCRLLLSQNRYTDSHQHTSMTKRVGSSGVYKGCYSTGYGTPTRHDTRCSFSWTLQGPASGHDPQRTQIELAPFSAFLSAKRFEIGPFLSLFCTSLFHRHSFSVPCAVCQP